MRRLTLAAMAVLTCALVHPPAARADTLTARQLPHEIQRQQMPLDCEAAALQAALSTMGIDDSQQWLMEQIPVDGRGAITSHGTVLEWGDPYLAFVGNVYGSEPRSTGYGVYAPPVAAAAERAGAPATWATHWTPSQLYAQVLAGHAAVVWVIQGLVGSTTRYYTAWDGRLVPYSVGEHAMALVGVDLLAGTVTLADPHAGHDVTVPMGVFERSFAVFENMAAVLGVPDGAGVVASPDAKGYVVAGSDGSVRAAGDSSDHGSMAGDHLNQPIVGIAATPGGGYWLVSGDGGVFPYGDAVGYGSTGGIQLNQPIVGVAATNDGRGYWLVAADGGIFPFGDAVGYGSTGAIRLNRPIVGMAVTPTGRGYWLVASDGGIFPFGDAGGYGSTGGTMLNQPIVAMAPSPHGYWLVAADGGIFPFGDARGLGSAAAAGPSAPIAGIAPTRDGRGYWLVARDGTVSAFGDALALTTPAA